MVEGTSLKPEVKICFNTSRCNIQSGIIKNACTLTFLSNRT